VQFPHAVRGQQLRFVLVTGFSDKTRVAPCHQLGLVGRYRQVPKARQALLPNVPKPQRD
jgi:hypothetical protein